MVLSERLHIKPKYLKHDENGFVFESFQGQPK